jgi:hypothetical protein
MSTFNHNADAPPAASAEGYRLDPEIAAASSR